VYVYVYGHEHAELNDACGGGDVAATDGFLLVQGMVKPKPKPTQKVRQNPSVHYLLPLLHHLLLGPFDPYQYRHHLRFLYQVGMYQMVIQEVAPGGGVIDEYE
jgi:hypothetical protein